MRRQVIDRYLLSALEYKLRASDPDYVTRLERIADVLLPPALPDEGTDTAVPRRMTA